MNSMNELAQSESQACPDKKRLLSFLTGTLPNPDAENIEQHLLDCSNCEDTIRMMDVNDTFDELAQSALAKLPIAENNQDESVIADLIERMRGISGSEYSTRSSKIRPSAKNRTLDERATEVIIALEPSQNESNIGRIGHYEVVELLGAGSSGVVFKALDEQLNRFVALKILRPSLGESARQRFLQEAQAAAAIDHENIITIYQVGEESSLAFIAMQLLPGETLEALLSREKKLAPDTAKEIARQITVGLSAAHEQGMIHRDIKPANIWLDEKRDRIKILDFGLARVADDDPKFTDTGMIAGTPTFMSPEQAKGSEIDQRSDLFSLGCVMYQMVTGDLPFYGKNVLATLQTILRHHPTPACDVDSRVPQPLSDLIRCLLAKQPDKRPATAKAVLEALDHEQSEWSFTIPEEYPTVTAKTKPQKSNLKWWIAATFVLLAGIGSYLFAGDIIRIATDQGELIIKTEDDNISVKVSQDGKQVDILDLKTNQSFNIKSGKYELSLTGDANGFEISKDTVTMTRGGKTIVTVSKAKTFNQNLSSQPNSNSRKENAQMRNLSLALQENISAIKTKVADLEMQILELQQNYGPDHPKVTHLNQQIDYWTSVLQQAELDPLDGNNDLTPTYSGKTVAEWLRLASTERNVSELHNVSMALEHLVDKTNIEEVVDAIDSMLAVHGTDDVTDRTGSASSTTVSFNQSIFRSFNSYPQKQFLELFLRYIENGSVRQRRALLGYLFAGRDRNEPILSESKAMVLNKNAEQIIDSLIELSNSDDRVAVRWLHEFTPRFIRTAELSPEQYRPLLPLVQAAYESKRKKAIIANTLLIAKHITDTEDLVETIARGSQRDYVFYEDAVDAIRALYLLGPKALPAKDVLILAMGGSYGGFGDQEIQDLAIKAIGNLGEQAKDKDTISTLAWVYGNRRGSRMLALEALSQIGATPSDVGPPHDSVYAEFLKSKVNHRSDAGSNN